MKDLDERRAELRELFRQYDLQDLRGAEFQRLLRLAHAEGLLDGFLQDIGTQGPRVGHADDAGLSRSVRLNDQFRMVFELDERTDPQTVTILSIEDYH